MSSKLHNRRWAAVISVIASLGLLCAAEGRTMAQAPRVTTTSVPSAPAPGKVTVTPLPAVRHDPSPARAPIVQRAAEPSVTEQWWFWAAAGAIVATAIVVIVVASAAPGTPHTDLGDMRAFTKPR